MILYYYSYIVWKEALLGALTSARRIEVNRLPASRQEDDRSVSDTYPGKDDEEAQRDTAAALLHRFVDEYSGPLYRAAFHLTGRSDDAQDLVQETFIRAWRFIDRFDPLVGNARNWLFKILMNVHIDYRRRQCRELRSADLLQADAADDLYLYKQAVASDDLRVRGNPEEAFFGTLVGGEVQAALQAVPAHYRQVFLLSLEGFAYHEIAEMLDIPIGTVMSRLHRARTMLEKSLWDYCVQTGRCRSDVAASLPAPCADACHYLYGFLDHELDERTLTAVQEHLAVCRQCCSRLEFQQRLEATIRLELGCRHIPRRFKSRLARFVSML